MLLMMLVMAMMPFTCAVSMRYMLTFCNDSFLIHFCTFVANYLADYFIDIAFTESVAAAGAVSVFAGAALGLLAA